MARGRTVVDYEAKMDMTPMIDCVFLLLIFFLCATKFKTLDYRLDASLPKDKGLRNVQVKPPKEIPEFRITVDAIPGAPENAYPRATFRIGRDTMVSLQNLNQMIQQEYWVIKNDARYQGEKIPAVVDGQGDVDFEYVVTAINACVNARVDEINFAPPIPDDIRARMGKVSSKD
jgi:biopolymer transport protein ExbD